MASQPDLIFFPESYGDLFAEWDRHPHAAPFAGGTALFRARDSQEPELPPVIISLERIEEMGRISRSERYLEIGAMAKLSKIIEMRKFAPDVLARCLRSISGPQLRNMATIGGNVCCRLDSAAALTALDAQYELRGVQSSRWVSAARFSPELGPGALGPRELLTRIRVPLDGWGYSAYKKFPGSGKCAVFLANPQKNMLADIRAVCKCADGILRDKDGEMLLIGKRLPLTGRIAAAFVAHWDAFLRGAEGVDEVSRREFAGFLEANVAALAE